MLGGDGSGQMLQAGGRQPWARPRLGHALGLEQGAGLGQGQVWGKGVYGMEHNEGHIWGEGMESSCAPNS